MWYVTVWNNQHLLAGFTIVLDQKKVRRRSQLIRERNSDPVSEFSSASEAIAACLCVRVPEPQTGQQEGDG